MKKGKISYRLFFSFILILLIPFLQAQVQFTGEEEDQTWIQQTYTPEGSSTEKSLPDSHTTFPSFPYGQDSLMRYIRNHLKYPAIALENGIQGKVVVEFTVKKEGSIENIKIRRGLDPSCDREAVRLIKNMPAWIAGTKDGEPVDMQFICPVNFRIY